MKKKFLTVLLTALVFLSTAFLGVSTVFRLEGVSVEITLLSSDSKTQAEALQRGLLVAYEGRSIFAVDDALAKEELKNYPYFRMTAFEKVNPNKLRICLVEDDEVYALQTANGYLIVSGQGVVVEERVENYNRLDGGENILVKGFTLSGEKGNSLFGDNAWESALAFCQALDESLEGIRRSVTSVEAAHKSPELFLTLTMKEGVKIYIESPGAEKEKKVEKAVDAYLSLSNGERIGGRITVLEVEGEIFAEYKSTDGLEK